MGQTTKLNQESRVLKNWELTVRYIGSMFHALAAFDFLIVTIRVGLAQVCPQLCDM